MATYYWAQPTQRSRMYDFSAGRGHMTTTRDQAIAIAQADATDEQTPRSVWTRDGWYVASVEPPDDCTDAEDAGWEWIAVVEPA